MKLVYRSSGNPVKVGDRVQLSGGEWVEITYFRPPHKPSSSGKVSVDFVREDWSHEYYTSVIGAEWIDREDR